MRLNGSPFKMKGKKKQPEGRENNATQTNHVTRKGEKTGKPQPTDKVIKNETPLEDLIQNLREPRGRETPGRLTTKKTSQPRQKLENHGHVRNELKTTRYGGKRYRERGGQKNKTDHGVFLLGKGGHVSWRLGTKKQTGLDGLAPSLKKTGG